jgi:AmmeMemoRadiSam system protein B
MDRPRLRPLEAFPIEERGQKLLALRDPSGLTEAVARLPPMAVAVLQLCDGETTRDDICAEFGRRYQSPLSREALDKLLDQLDQAYLLDSDRFRQFSASVFAEFARSPVRPAHLAGKSYPKDPTELTAFLDAQFDPPNGPGRPAPGTRPLPRAIISPHIDFQRGGAAYAWAYRPLADADALPERIVIFGTDHGGADHPFTLTKKHYETPLGRLDTDGEIVAKVSAGMKTRLGDEAAEALFYNEHHHRGEHSLEFQTVWLRHILGARADGIQVVPILCGSMHDFVEGIADPSADPRLTVFIEELLAALGGRPTLWIAGADLAHVGPRFGDVEPLDNQDRASLEKRDQETLMAAARGDARAWFEEIRREKDRRRVCGLPPIYAMLTAARPGAGKLLAYGQCPADEKGGSLVSIASLVYPASDAVTG